MDQQESDEIKERELCFCSLHPERCEAGAAKTLLDELDGILSTQVLDDCRLLVRYDIRRLCLEIIENALAELGFHLDNSLLTKIRRALYYYTEEVQRENMGITKDQQNCTRSVFVNRYQNLEHGCRDSKQDYWRKYQ